MAPSLAVQPRENPFEFTRPLDRPDEAMLRSDDAAAVRDRVRRNECVSVLAPRQTGKTTFLHEVRRLIGERCVYVDLETADFDDMEGLTHDLAQRINRPWEPQGGGRKSADHLKQFLQATDGPESRVFLIDELHSLKHERLQFLKCLRAYYSEGFVQSRRVHNFVIAGSIDLADWTLGSDSDVSPYNIAMRVSLADFDRQQVGDFITRRSPGNFSDRSIDRIFEWTSGHPYLVQFLCRHLHGLPPGRAEAELSDLAVLVDSSKVEASHNVTTMVAHLLERGDDPRPAVSLLEQITSGRRFPFSASSELIRSLCYRHGIIKDVGGWCAIRNPIYELVLHRQLDLRKTLEPREPPGFEDYFEKLKAFEGWVSLCVIEPDGTPCQTVPGGPAGVAEGPDDADAVTASGVDEHVTYAVRAKGSYILQVRLAKGDAPKPDGSVTWPLSIEGEKPDGPIEFGVRPQSLYDLGLRDEQTLVFGPDAEHADLICRFAIATAEATASPITVDVTVYQHVSLVTVKSLSLKVS